MTRINKLITVYIEEPDCLNGLRKIRGRINWSAIGPQDIKTTEAFARRLLKVARRLRADLKVANRKRSK